MRKTDYLIIGGSAAGTTAAEVIRGIDPKGAITIISEEPHEQYSRVLIPHYLRHKVSREQVFLKKPEWYGEKKIELVKGVRAKSLEPSRKEVVTSDGETYQYKKLLIAVGGRVVPFNAPGADLENVLYMRTIENADDIIAAASQAKRGVIIGGGFIGLEFSSSFKSNGVEDVTILVREPYFWQGKLDESSSRVLVGVLTRNGIKVLTGEEVDRFDPARNVILGSEATPESDSGRARMTVGSVVTKSGKSFEAQVVGIGVGIKPDLDWLKNSGIEVNRGILTNEYLETTIPDVYAAGDCAEFADVVFGRQHIVGNWANATSQGNAVGKNMAATLLRQGSEGQGKTVFETASSYSINFFDGSCSFIGVTDSEFADEIVTRGSVGGGKMTQIYVKTIDGVMRIVGATVINNPGEVAPLSAAIKGKIDIFRNKA
ncbi:MAG: FAD-dependent oxidoreductase, partial [Candidatus Curtissbacteria bacterium]